VAEVVLFFMVAAAGCIWSVDGVLGLWCSV
jgi:hypothetical protein